MNKKMELKYRLLDHPFYKSWSDGAVTTEQLAKYGASYSDFIKKIPDFWKKIITDFSRFSIEGMTIINEEKSHIAMWNRWLTQLEPAENYPKMDVTITQFELMNTSELLGALHAFEIQQPEVAFTKKQGLMKFYGFKEKDLVYFDEHMAEDDHINFGKMLADKYADAKDFKNGFEKGSELIYKSLDLFVEC